MTQTLKKIFSCSNLNTIYNRNKKNRNSSNVENDIVTQLHSKIVNNSYKPQKLSFYTLPKGDEKERVICQCTPEDSLLQRTLLAHLNTKLKQLGLNNNINFCIKGRSVKAAIAESVERRNKKQWVLKADIAAFFDTIDRNLLIDMLGKKKQITKSILPMLIKIINTEINTKSKMDKDRLESNGIKQGRGLRQGMPLSPLLASFFLSDFDKKITKKELNIIRYADDIIFFGSTEKECQECEKIIKKNLKKTGLHIPNSTIESKTKIYSPEEPVIFLGIEIYKCQKSAIYQQRIPDKKIKEVLKELDKYNNFEKSIKSLKIKNLTLNLVLEKLRSIVNGYFAAYRNTSNYESFKNKLNDKQKNVQNELLISILGKSVFNNLDEEKKKFLGFVQPSS